MKNTVETLREREQKAEDAAQQQHIKALEQHMCDSRDDIGSKAGLVQLYLGVTEQPLPDAGNGFTKALREGIAWHLLLKHDGNGAAAMEDLQNMLGWLQLEEAQRQQRQRMKDTMMRLVSKPELAQLHLRVTNQPAPGVRAQAGWVDSTRDSIATALLDGSGGDGAQAERALEELLLQRDSWVQPAQPPRQQRKRQQPAQPLQQQQQQPQQRQRKQKRAGAKRRRKHTSTESESGSDGGNEADMDIDGEEGQQQPQPQQQAARPRTGVGMRTRSQA